ncbi:DUF1499 domain-containing protein [Leptothoe kymatousa]|uniref:DUF1499 domain-containing protein n=1 Tax=Leptothoe kymatousa TAU-MAC 1615 TaxID=2364775 RepID=A0ABS5Y4B5_9CYAN|nr:DUF1499 domain-containing protein [Leptothoe kymatousa]MBT9312684.1 DUF1499 domain-containing protein [Leptothoe kymatousa TAU-MAC 1615]
MALFSFSGTRPNNLGVTDGQLLACPGTPNCVSTQADSGDKEHYIAPLTTDKSPADAIAHLKTIIEGMERSTIIESTDTYLYAEFSSKLMGFVDDIEFYATAGTVQMRAAARLGKSDLGVNRKRMEAIRTQFQA